jgi:hypothetical protein
MIASLAVPYRRRYSTHLAADKSIIWSDRCMVRLRSHSIRLLKTPVPTGTPMITVMITNIVAIVLASLLFFNYRKFKPQGSACRSHIQLIAGAGRQ